MFAPFSDLKRFASRLWLSTHSRPKGKHWARLRLEELESRFVPSTLTPAQIRHAYGIDQASYIVNGRTIQGDGSGQTIAIVSAYHDPYISRDLQTFDRQFGLSDPNFHQYYYGSASNTNDQWSQETALDVEWAHAIAPKANILLIEAASNKSSDLYQAVNWVRQQAGVSVVSMSWGARDFSGENGLDSYLTTPSGHNGITFVAASGDGGAGELFPAISPNVVAVGGTNLNVDSRGNYQSETAWGSSGGGYSNYEREPGFQQSVQNSGRRTGPDVAYNAGTGVYIAWSQPSTGRQSWYSMTGTSAGAPQWAGIVAIADQIRIAAGRHTLDGASQTLYALYNSVMTGDFHDITIGSNGYSARSGYDLVTGRGTPYAQKVILDLARVNDNFHGAVVTSARATALTGNSAATLAIANQYVQSLTVDSEVVEAPPAAGGDPDVDVSASSMPAMNASPGVSNGVDAGLAVCVSALTSSPEAATCPEQPQNEQVFSEIGAVSNRDVVNHWSGSEQLQVAHGSVVQNRESSDAVADTFVVALSQEHLFTARLWRWAN
jgi:subtilase family serine protease